MKIKIKLVEDEKVEILSNIIKYLTILIALMAIALICMTIMLAPLWDALRAAGM